MQLTGKQIGQRVYEGFLCVLIIGFGIGFLCFPAETAGGVSSGLALCLYTLIPATFPFLVLSSFCVHSGFSRILGKILAPITKHLFYLPGCCGSVILLSWLGGYPSGVRGIVSLYQRGMITQEQGKRMLWFCVNAGPSFTISVIGSGVYQSTILGVFLFLTQTAGLMAMGIFTGIRSKIHNKKALQAISEHKKAVTVSFSNALVLAANDSARGTANLCCFVMLFTALLEPLNSSGFLRKLTIFLQNLGFSPPAAASFFPFTWEITSGVNFGSWAGAPLELLAFSTAFGGLCVLMQILAAAIPLQISKIKFLLSRVIHGIVSFLLFLLFKPLFYLPEPASNVFHNTTERLQQQISSSGNSTITSAICGVVLLLFCAVFLICNKKNRLEKMH